MGHGIAVLARVKTWRKRLGMDKKKSGKMTRLKCNDRQGCLAKIYSKHARTDRCANKDAWPTCDWGKNFQTIKKPSTRK